MLNSCPDCDKPIRADAFKCSCGWVKPSSALNARPIIDCAFHGCRSPAVVRLRKPTGWANMCEYHYSNDNLQESKDYCEQHGLDTTEKKIAHIMALLKTPRDPRAWMKNPKSEMARRWRDEILGSENKVERVPGEDDELQEAA